MKISKVHIETFRGFKQAEVDLGEQVTVIAGQNGTQKSTLLGMLTQPFTNTDKSGPINNEKPLSGGNFKSAFKEKFNLSDKFDKAKEHEWTLHFKNDEHEPFTVESIDRDKNNSGIRFWKKGKRGQGDGYIQKPVIFLSLKRLIPIAEESVKATENVSLTPEEKTWYQQEYNKILVSQDDLKSINYIEGKNKNTLGVETDYYDWNTNSAGQDNIGKILLAVLSFRRLKEKHPDDYNGGILAIDEIDATLYPASQVELIRRLASYSSKWDIQVVATTHSLSILKEIADTVKKRPARSKDLKIVYLKKVNTEIRIESDTNYERIKNHLNVVLGGRERKKLQIYTEDAEARDFLKSILGNKYKEKVLSECNLGCKNLLQLVKSKVPSFLAPESIIILDGDEEVPKRRGRADFSNVMTLPGNNSPERILASFLSTLDDDDIFWTKYNVDYSKQLCFRTYSLKVILSDRVKAKEWYIEQKGLDVFGRNGSFAFKSLLESSEIFKQQKEKFLENFNKLYNEYLEQLN